MVEPVLDVICLCAAWCGTCKDYGATFEALKAQAGGHRFRWIDIEDEADLVGDIDVETFPTLLIAHAGRVLFAGPVLPRLSDAHRLLEVHGRQAREGGATDLRAAGMPDAQIAAYEALAGALRDA